MPHRRHNIKIGKAAEKAHFHPLVETGRHKRGFGKLAFQIFADDLAFRDDLSIRIERRHLVDRRQLGKFFGRDGARHFQQFHIEILRVNLHAAARGIGRKLGVIKLQDHPVLLNGGAAASAGQFCKSAVSSPNTA